MRKTFQLNWLKNSTVFAFHRSLYRKNCFENSNNGTKTFLEIGVFKSHFISGSLGKVCRVQSLHNRVKLYS